MHRGKDLWYVGSFEFVEGSHLSDLYRLLAMLTCLFAVQTACAQDTEPPNVLSFDFDPKAVDTSASSQEITFTARLTDDLSGVDLSTQARFCSPSGNQFVDVGFWPPGGLISGDELDGIYESKLTLPQHSEQGTWKIEYFLLVDKVRNTRWLNRDELVSLGFPTTFLNDKDESSTNSRVRIARWQRPLRYA